jgi:hypothetical protein
MPSNWVETPQKAHLNDEHAMMKDLMVYHAREMCARIHGSAEPINTSCRVKVVSACLRR